MRPTYCPAMCQWNWLALLYAEDAAWYEGDLSYAAACYNEAVKYGVIFA
jgi:hypothetical protein